MATTKFDIGDKVFALESYKVNKDVSINTGISIATVKSIVISKKVEYWVASYPSGEEWGDTIPEEHISNDINDLTKYLVLSLT